jgi:hypothetical protein
MATRSERAIAKLSDAELAAWLESLGPNDAELAAFIEAEQDKRRVGAMTTTINLTLRDRQTGS